MVAKVGLLDIILQVSYLALWDPWSAPFGAFFASFRLSYRPNQILAIASLVNKELRGGLFVSLLDRMQITRNGDLHPADPCQDSTRVTSEAVTKAHQPPDLGIYPLSIAEGLSRTWEMQIIEQRSRPSPKPREVWPFSLCKYFICVCTAIRYTGRSGVFPHCFEQATRRGRKKLSKVRETLVTYSLRSLDRCERPILVIHLNIIRGRIPVL
jgi:hypothetical protein